VDYTVARISNPEYYARGSVLSRERLGIDLMINPEREAARETFQLLQSAAATDVANFAEGRVQLVGLMVREGAPVVGKTLAQLGEELSDKHYVVAAIVRNEETIIPNGSSTLQAGDHIYVLSPRTEVIGIPPLAGYEPFHLKRVMIAGGSAEGMYLAEMLEENGIECTILRAPDIRGENRWGALLLGER
jgi:trk system potassium uptake protein TrkA